MIESAVRQRQHVCRGGFLAALVLICAMSIGCGSADPGPPRFHIAGTVMYNGAPIPHGEIFFEPDPDANNKGPSTRVTIENGEYSTKNSKVNGVIGGPMIVRINGTDGKESGTMKHGAPLFKEYTTKVEVPTSESTEDFEVPAKR